MKPIIKVILWCAAIVFIVRGCFMYTEMTHLSQDDLKWVTGYYKDNATFVSDSGNVSKLTIWGEFVENRTDPFAYTFETGSQYEAGGGYKFKVTDNLRELDDLFAIIRKVDSDTLKTFFHFGTRYSNSYEPKIIVESFKINETELDSCFIIDSYNSRIPDWSKDTINHINRFVVSKKYGLVYYQLASGEQFYRKFE